MAKPRNQRHLIKKTHQPEKTKNQPSWALFKGLILSCKYLQPQQQQPKPHKMIQKQHQKEQSMEKSGKRSKKMKCSGSLCNNTNVLQRPETESPEFQKNRAFSSNAASSSNRFLREINGVILASSSSSSSSLSTSSSTQSSSIAGSFRAMPFRRFSGCYECKMVADTSLGITREPSSLRSSIFPCIDCGEIFIKSEDLELHQAITHAVSEVVPEDTSKNIVEIIFQSSWLRKQTPICKIDRILKVHNTQKTISRFEEYRDSIKTEGNKVPKKHPRCIADGNELLRFHSTTLACSLGLNGSTNLCNSIAHCDVCRIIKDGFEVVRMEEGRGIFTSATSGNAHDKAVEVAAGGGGGDKRVMLVCRVIAGRVKRGLEVVESSMKEYDSIGWGVGAYSNLDELYVFNPKAILPCFVVVYSGF